MLSTKLRQARRALDKQLQTQNPVAPRKGWLAAIRQSIGMSGQQFADRLGVAWQSMDDLEKSEAAGTITVNSLRRAAAVLDCTLVYAVVPRAGSLEAMVRARSRELALEALARSGQTMLLEDQAAGADQLESSIEDYIDDNVRDADLWAVRR